jgi:hypothetical protein
MTTLNDVRFNHTASSSPLVISSVAYVTPDFPLPTFMWFQAQNNMCSVRNIRYPCVHSFIHQWLYSPLLGPGLFFSFVIVFTDCRIPWTSDQPVSKPLPTHRTAQTVKTHTQTSMPWVGFDPMIPAFERAKTVHALARSATVIGYHYIT